jgi:hypothetical protein
MKRPHVLPSYVFRKVRLDIRDHGGAQLAKSQCHSKIVERTAMERASGKTYRGSGHDCNFSLLNHKITHSETVVRSFQF